MVCLVPDWLQKLVCQLLFQELPPLPHCLRCLQVQEEDCLLSPVLVAALRIAAVGRGAAQVRQRRPLGPRPKIATPVGLLLWLRVGVMPVQRWRLPRWGRSQVAESVRLPQLLVPLHLPWLQPPLPPPPWWYLQDAL